MQLVQGRSIRYCFSRALFLGRGCLTLLLAGASVVFPAPGQAALLADEGTDHVQAVLVAEHDGVAPGEAARLGVRLRHAPHWHTYWVVPGDAGLPTQLRWALEPGYQAGPIEWPAPQRLRAGNLANYGYEGEILLPVAVRVPPSARVGSTAHFRVRADWLVCNDLCIPGGADLSLELPVRAPADLRPSTESGEFAAARARVPAPLHLAGASARMEGDRIRLEFPGKGPAPHALEFFPLEPGRIEAAADQVLAVQGTGATRVRLVLKASAPIAPDFRALRGVLVADGGPGSPAHGWLGAVDLALERAAAPALSAAAAANPGSPSPPPAGIPATASSPAPAVPPAGTVPAAPAAALPAASPLSGLLALFGAFLGGAILNLMPCVFPVLSLKLIGLVKHRGDAPAVTRAHGLAFGAGVIASFLVLAGLLLALRAAGSQIGWGFQLQSPLVIAGLIGLFFLIGLNLLGAFEFTFGSGIANTRVAQATDGDGLRGSFATGVLAALVASPCTAPFMGAALGYAVTQSAPMALLVFACLGAGMAAPYVVLTMVPAWLRHLPRPGAWMERLKQIMAFPMFLTCVWLFWVLGQQIDIDAVAGLLAAMVGLGLFAWATGLAQRGSRAFRWLAASAALVTAVSLVPLARAVLHPAPESRGAAGTSAARSAGAPADPAAGWSSWSPDAQGRALADGRPVFVDFTAAWCITCQANKRLVLHDARVEAAFRDRGVTRLQADWTRRDESISRELARFSRSGVPMYVLYDRKGSPHLFPEILSTQLVLDALAGV
jgi:thiol:disulfide interchange protein/DsbC/DsbD-like thiol-disulfide interchange protein